MTLPNLITGFLEHFEDFEDPRYEGFVTYPLPEIFLAALVGIVCGAEDWGEIVLICEEKLKVLRRFLPYENGIASAKTLWRVFEVVNHEAFGACFAAWSASLAGKIEGVVAIDGKSLRGTGRAGSERALHVLSAYAHASGLVIGQACVDAKSNEITAIPELLDSLSIEGTTVTIDAMGTQTDIARAIINKGADYVLALKGNQGMLHQDARLFFADEELARTCASHTTAGTGHGRIEERTCRATGDIAWLAERHPDWAGLTSIAEVTATRTDKKSGKTSTERRLYISSLPPAPETLLATTRAHWSIENELHWNLDVNFHEDACQTAMKNAALNLSIVRKLALALLKRHTDKLPIKRKIKKAACNDAFLTETLC
jgi:predicted transposase YbfD/YdcC